MIHKEQALERGIKIIDSKESHNALFENLKTHFPQTIKDNQVDLGAIAMLLGLETKANIQGYELTFSGKALANALYSTPTQKLLKFEESFNVRSAESSKEDSNFIIKGDNLDVLKILKAAYSEKIKMIYIDPPYNTKNENFIYPDNFRKDYKAILQEVGLLEIDDEGNEVESETLQFFKNIQSTRTHSGWLAFMLPRLKLARDLLREDGVIFISIDDNEQANLKILCDEIFGEENFVGNLIWQKKKGGGGSDSMFFQKEHEYVLCYQKQEWDINDITESHNEKDFNKIINGRKAKIRKLEKDGDKSLRTDRPTLYYAIKDLNGKDFYPQTPNGAEGRWRKKPETLDSEHIHWQEDSKGRLTPYEVVYFDEVQDKEKVIKTRTIFTEYGTTTEATKEILSIFNNEKIFDTPKPISLIKHLLKISTNANAESVIASETKQSSLESKTLDCHDLQSKSRNDTDLESKAGEAEVSCDDFVGCQGGGEGSLLNINDRADNADSRKSTQETTPDIVLDFFAGSGTTAHAVMELNAEDNGNRKFILVQIDEPINESKNKTAYDFCKNELKSKNPAISDITIERVKRAGAKIANANPNFNVGFNVLALSDKPELISTEQGTLELLSNANLSPFDKALNLALQSGKTLDKPLKTIFENRLYQCEDCLYLIACDKEVLEFLRKSQNEYIFIDGFEDLHLEDFLNLDSSLNDRLRIVY